MNDHQKQLEQLNSIQNELKNTDRLIRHFIKDQHKVSKKITELCSSANFFFAHLIVIGLWILFNYYFQSFDPYPFDLLAFILSVEAALLSILVLMGQAHDQYVDGMTTKIILYLITLNEEENTQIINMLKNLMDYHGIEVDEASLGNLTAVATPRKVVSAIMRDKKG
jgi:uncharacterized membrane protein